jgi:electron transfer flavoprotein alpha subunit
MAILILAEHDQHSIKDTTLNTISAATKLGSDIHLLVLGHHCSKAAEQAATIQGVSKVLTADHASYAHALAENMAATIVELARTYSHILAPSTTFGKNIMPRVAALLDVAQVTDVIEIISADTFKRPIYAGNAIATVQSTDTIKILTIRTTAFAKAAMGNTAKAETITAKDDTGLSSFVTLKSSDASGPDLTSARVVISGGRGLGSAENFKLLELIAKKIGNCAIGASRAAVDAGYVPSDYQVGQTGKVVAPELYIAVGISGAIQHLAGMKDSKVIVAINKDENAPIFEIADYGLVADLFQALPKFEQLIS